MACTKYAIAFVAVASGFAAAEVCTSEDCAGEETSLLSLKGSISAKRGTQCKNRFDQPFPCGPGECCGDICMAAKGVCCTNDLGNSFVCGEGSSCCGNACAAPGNTCCEGATGYKYPVATECTETAQSCFNREGQEFWCAASSSCCGDVCVAAGGTCCQNTFGNDFSCGAGSSCCGSGCVAPGGKCCAVDGVEFPEAEGVPCPASVPGIAQLEATPAPSPAPVTQESFLETSSSVTCFNRYATKFWCAAGSGCCGDICVAPGGQCCVNEHGNNFVCGSHSRCAGNICLSVFPL